MNENKNRIKYTDKSLDNGSWMNKHIEMMDKKLAYKEEILFIIKHLLTPNPDNRMSSLELYEYIRLKSIF